MKRLYREIIFWTVLIDLIAHIMVGFYDIRLSVIWLMYETLGIVFFLLCYTIYRFYIDLIRGES